MYKLNSSESVKILKTVFDVKTCKKLSFSKGSDDESESNESLDEPTSKTVETAKEEPKGKSSKTVETAKTVESTSKTAKEEPKGKSSKTVETTKEEPKGKSKVVKEEVSAGAGASVASKKKPDLTDSKKTTTSKVKESKTRIPLSDSDDELQSDNDLDM